MTPDARLNRLKHEEVTGGYQRCEEKIQQYHDGTLERLPGCNLEETLESHMNGMLGRLRNKVGDMCKRELPPFNSALVMENCGSKGSALNICQMIACVGQQAVNGARIPEGFIARTLPHFPENAKDPPAKGFVVNSFFTGLRAEEFFFHTMGGREGLVDTAVKTAQTGYMQRRMVKAMEDLCVNYDTTVRGCMGDVYQFRYGDDGLDPSKMEANDRPVDLGRVLFVIKADPAAVDSRFMSPFDIMTFAEATVEDMRNLCLRRTFRDELEGFMQGLAHGLAKHLKALGVADPQSADVDLNLGSTWMQEFAQAAAQSGSAESPVDSINALRKARILTTQKQLQMLHETAIQRYLQALAHPGEAVGVGAAHSLGEPATQMTLKTFHFAGVATMNVTLGVPRITEIINANVKISTPVIKAALLNESSEAAARAVKARLERTTLGQVCEYIREVYSPYGPCILEVKLDLKNIDALYLRVTLQSVTTSILKACSPRLKPEDIHCSPPDRLFVSLPAKGFRPRSAPKPKVARDTDNSYSSLQMLRRFLPTVVVQGLVDRAVISQVDAEEGGGGASDGTAVAPRYHILIEDGNLSSIIGVDGLRGTHCTSNDVMQVETVLGIEAARSVIMSEVMTTYKQYGINLNVRHLAVLADMMTRSGNVLGITRFGIEKMKESVLANASFEKTPDHLFNAAVHSRVDVIKGVSACVILGRPIELGTGSFQLMQQATAAHVPLLRKPARAMTLL